jgi:hypothetical protein
MHWHGPTGFAVRGKRGGMVGKGKGPCQRNSIFKLMKIYWTYPLCALITS